MEPNLFHIDWERTAEALTLIIVLSFVVERALAIFFEVPSIAAKVPSGAKALISLVVSVVVCSVWHFDALSIIILAEKTTVPGYVLTGAVIAGGSKASIKLFHDILGVKSETTKAAEQIRRKKTVQNLRKAASSPRTEDES